MGAIAEKVTEQISEKEKLYGRQRAESEFDAVSVKSGKAVNTLKANLSKIQADYAKNEIQIHRSVSKSANVGDISLSRKSSIIEDPMVASAKLREHKDQAKFPITRICLTGGPCAGKTTALTSLSLHLKQIGYRVLLVPEAATILMQGGAMIKTPTMTFSNAVKFQISLMKL